MKITKTRLKEIIAEEVKAMFSEEMEPEERWAVKGDVQMRGTGIPELKAKILKAPGMATVHVAEDFFGGGFDLNTFDKEQAEEMQKDEHKDKLEAIIASFNNRGGDYNYADLISDLKSMVEKYGSKPGAYGETQVNSAFRSRLQRRKQMQDELSDLRSKYSA